MHIGPVGGALVGILALASSAAAETAADATAGTVPVEITFEPYLWAPTVDGKVGLGVLSLPVHVTPHDLASGFRMGAMGRVAVSQGPKCLSIEAIGVDFKRDRFGPLLGQDVAMRVLALEMTGGYRLDPNARVSITPLIGMRYNSINARFGTKPALLRAEGDWLEPAAGLLVSARTLDRLELSGKLLAGYRDSQRHSLDLRADAAFSFHPRTQIFAGYRYMKQEFASADADGLAIDLRGQGPLLGLRHHF